MRKIDHLVYCVEDLTTARTDFKSKYGLESVIGGKHLKHGTHNALINLGNQCYLEILAIDKENEVDPDHIWMGLNFLQNEKFTRWALKSDDILFDQSCSMKYDPALSELSEGQRKKPDGAVINWQMIRPISTPEVEIFPFFLDWSSSHAHPTDDIPISGQLLSLSLTHPEPSRFETHFKALGIDLTVTQGVTAKILAKIKTSKGVFVI